MDIDKKIIRILKNNARESNQNIARNLGVSEGTIRNRIKSLTENGKIKRFTVIASTDVSAICMVETIAGIETSKIVEKIMEINDIVKIYEISGEYSVVCNIESSTISELNDSVELIRKIEGVNDTKTYTILKDH
ncbi:hypothetical protein C0585_04175 [Candidatus Woesearchaeota archaeon]|nr:MAG: hypothetical protein C0585_04175 [Candidatus Woesearchaeota archaeon]